MYYGEKFNAWSHLVGALLATVGAVWLLVLASQQHDIWKVVSVAVYGVCLVGLYSASTVYHSVRGRAKQIMRKVDHFSIYLMIAGSYTPFTTQRFEGLWAIGFTTLIWTLAFLGAGVKLFAPRISDKFWSGVYVVFGWLAVAALKPMVETVHPIALALLVIGGLIYTAGVFVFISPRVKFRRAIWHGFVVTGATVHWTAVLVGVVLAPAMSH